LILIVSIVICIIAIILITILLLNRSKKPNNNTQSQEEIHYDTIQFTQYNEIPYAYISDMQMCNTYLLDYKNNIIFNIQEAFNKLDKEYMEKRFGNFENYRNYVQENINDILEIKLAKYQINQYDTYTQYICIDQFGNYYIFNETAIMKYSVILDTYTIDLPQYTENYNKANKTEKVAMCVDRFMKSINDKNYEFAYSLLASGFKNNYFKTKEEFITYAKQNLVGRDKITYKAIDSQEEIYLYTVVLEDEDALVKTKELTFIVKLKEGTGFELSFEM
jgi:hypothetical protein